MSEETILDTCGCCQGIQPLTPASLENPPGLSTIAYRIGTHTTFKETMLAGLSRRRALDRLTTRESDDPAIALVDAAATMLDVLTFYQERIANEGYLRTATERRSILELARSVGYELSPGMAASTYLAFELETAPVSPRRVTIEKGVKVQSLPGPGEQPQTFETIEKIEARTEWNILKPQQTQLHYPAKDDTAAYIQGVNSNLKVGDGLLFIGSTGETETREFRRVDHVEVDAKSGTTRVTWVEKLTEAATEVHTFRQKAALFGHNAPDWLAMSKEVKENYLGTTYDKTQHKDWPYTAPTGDAEKTLNLDSRYPSITAQSWVVVERPDLTSPILAKVTKVYEVVATGFTLSSNVTQLTLDKGVEQDTLAQVRQTSLLVQSEELPLAETPLLKDFRVAPEVTVSLGKGTLTPLAGNRIAGNRIVLDRLVEGLQKGQTLIVSGKLIRVMVKAANLKLRSADGGTERPLSPGETLRVLEPPTCVWRLPIKRVPPIFVPWQAIRRGLGLPSTRPFGSLAKPVLGPLAKGLGPHIKATLEPDIVGIPGFHSMPWPEPSGGDGSKVSWHLQDAEGFEGLVAAEPSAFALVSAAEDDPVVSEVAVLKETPAAEGKARTVLEFTEALAYLYDRATVRIYANIARATHGETKREVLGSGQAGQPFQRFVLKQKPLTYISAPTSTGRESTLEVRVNDIRWEEAPSLYARGPKDPTYIARLADDGTVSVQFGDGVMGARLPTGVENVVATYRVGTGLAGLVKANQISLLMTRPLGVKGVTNPLAPTGAADPETRDQARRNAPRTVLTLDRIVSLKDYEDFALAFSGIGKAQAVELRRGETRLVHLTVAAADGGRVEPTSELYKNLTASIAAQSDEHQPFVVESYTPRQFNVAAKVRIHPEYLPEKVLAAMRQALLETFSFEARSFGQPVTGSEVIAVMQRVAGVVAVDLDFLYFAGQPMSLPPDLRLKVEIARWDGSRVLPAELLTINPNGIELSEVKP